MRRREFIAGLGSAAAWPIAARAQQPTLPVVGWLHPAAPASMRDYIAAFHRGLAETGYVDGRNVAVEYRWAEGHFDRLAALAADLVRRQVAVIVAPSTTQAALAAKAATQTIPIVFNVGGDPVELGLVASFNRPAGNLTGVAVLGGAIAPKRLELLHRLVPGAASIGMLVNPANPLFTEVETRDIQSAARVLGVRLLVLNAGTDRDIAAAFATLAEQQCGALLIGGDIFFYAARDQIIPLATRYALPAMFYDSASIEAGGLLSYGPDRADAWRQVGVYSGRILKGDNAADLPVARPTKFELVINLQTAKTLGLEVPAALLALADRVIE